MGGSATTSDHDLYQQVVNGIPVGVHFYFLDNSLMGPNRINLSPVLQSGQVMSFLYVPFITRRDIDIVQIPYDQGRYGSVDPSNPNNYPHCYVYKVNDSFIGDKPLGTVKRYRNETFGRKNEWRWYNESKLFQFPYEYITINDYMNTPLTIAPHLFTSPGDDFPVKVRQEISFTGGYTIYAQGYKGDYNGTMEGIMSTASLDLPTGSSAYADFMSRSKSQFLASNLISSRNESLARYSTNKQAQLGYASANMSYNAQIQAGRIGALGSVFSGLSGGLMGVLGAGVGAGLGLASNQISASTSRNIANMQTSTAQQIGNMQNSLNKKNRIDQSQAFISDIFSAPRNMSLGSGDILQSLTNSRKCVDVIRYGLTDVYLNKIALYFTMYGYKQNKFVRLTNSSYKTRKYFNYIKTIDANIESKKLPKEIVEQIKAIFNAGITFWHYKNMQNIEYYPMGQESAPQQTSLKMYEYTRFDNGERNIVYPGTNTVIPDDQIPPQNVPPDTIVPPGGQP